MEKPVRQKLLEAVEKVDRPGTFCTSGVLPPIMSGLEAAGVGAIALPLDKHVAVNLTKHARQAPYGKGTETLVDTEVRRVWEIDADQVTLANPEWPEAIKRVLETVQAELGLADQKLEAHLYKLLLYETGSFFLAHRDGEKLDRMVATLVIALPSAHEGGQLIVRHEGRETVVDFGPKSRFETQFAAFYADCEHAILPVTSGFRLALVYNLTLAKSAPAIAAPSSRGHVAAIAGILSEWGEQRPKATEGAPSKLAVLLDHRYSQAGLNRDALKGVDRSRAEVLFEAAKQAGCEASLALATYWESGSAEPSGDYGYGHGYSRRRSYRRYDDDSEDGDNDEAGEHVMGEVLESSLTAEHFSDADGNPLDFGEIPLDDGEIVSRTPLGEGTPDQEDFEGYTGNAGMTLERWYHRAAVLLWPIRSRFDVLCEAGVTAAVGGLEQMVRRWEGAKKTDREALKPDCLEFARRIIENWPEQKFYYGYGSRYSDDFDDEGEEFEDQVGSFSPDDAKPLDRRESASVKAPPSLALLSLLKTLGDPALVSFWIRGVLAKDVSAEPGKTLGRLCERHGWATFREELQTLFEHTSDSTLERHARLLADFALRGDADGRKLASELARLMMSAVERLDPARQDRDWRSPKVDAGKLLAPLARAFLALDEPELLERLVAYVSERPIAFDLTTVQVPALLGLQPWLEKSVKQRSAGLHRWLGAILEELDRRTSQPPHEPSDWRRESATGCKCGDCKELSRFLDDPNTQTLRLPLAEGRRQHLHQVIDGRRLDTSHVTERRGRPYTLVCTKSQDSYERALKAHLVDLDQQQQIRKLLDWNDGLHSSHAPRPQRGAKQVKGK